MEKGFQCPHCFSWNRSSVVDTRKGPVGIERRRRCSCGKDTHTLESTLRQKPLYVRKRSLKRELYSKEKLRHGLELAFAKVPVDSEEIDDVAQCVTEKAHQKEEDEITSREICSLILEELEERIDHPSKGSDQLLLAIVYVRFATLRLALNGEAQKIERLSEKVIALVESTSLGGQKETAVENTTVAVNIPIKNRRGRPKKVQKS